MSIFTSKKVWNSADKIWSKKDKGVVNTLPHADWGWMHYGLSNIHRTLDFCTDHQGKNWIYQSYRLARVLLSNLYIVKPAIEKHILLYNNQQQRKHFSHFPPPSATYVRMYSPILKKWGQCLSDFVLHLNLAISEVSILEQSISPHIFQIQSKRYRKDINFDDFFLCLMSET